jgi:hypothetical protein
MKNAQPALQGENCKNAVPHAAKERLPASPIPVFYRRMIFPENRYPFFGIMR